MATIHWIDDDAGYEEWLSAHPDGFMANVFKHGGKYFLMHRATHKLPDRSRPETANPRTGNRYSKVTAQRIPDLIAWARENLSALKEIGPANYCKICTPDSNAPVDLAPTTNFSEYSLHAEQMRSRGHVPRPVGLLKPAVTTGTTALYYRDPKVRAWVLQRADDCCELCGTIAPFLNDDEIPYLESHHIVMLSQGGSDTPDNTAAFCPNCHRNLHHGKEREQLREKLSIAIMSKEALTRY